jgi:diadenosine tetraphosphate (Ap4A) HIT family hydrolase
MPSDDCFICRKHRGEVALPPGGYLWEDETWLVCHAPAEIAGAGTLILESRQHVLDFEDMPPQERASFGPMLGRLYPAIRRGTGAERIYLVSTMGRVAHFHAWLVPWPADATLRGPEYLAEERSCSMADAIAAAQRIRAALAPANTDP